MLSSLPNLANRKYVAFSREPRCDMPLAYSVRLKTNDNCGGRFDKYRSIPRFQKLGDREFRALGKAAQRIADVNKVYFGTNLPQCDTIKEFRLF